MVQPKIDLDVTFSINILFLINRNKIKLKRINHHKRQHVRGPLLEGFALDYSQQQIIIEQKMSTNLKSSLTIDTNQRSSASLHNCPSCHCQRLEPGSPCHIRIQPQPVKSLYLSHHFDTTTYSPRASQSLFRSNILSNRITFGKSPPASPRRTNITFSYTSPSHRRDHSMDAKLTTKNFKQRHFPGLGLAGEEPLRKVEKEIKKQEKKDNYYKIYTDAETPKKPRILKLNKAKSKQKLQITISNKNSQKSITEYEQKPEEHLNNAPYNDYGLDVPKPTPINALWESQFNGGSISPISRSQFMQKSVHTPSIEHIQIRGSESEVGNPLSRSHFIESKMTVVDPKMQSIRSIQANSETVSMTQVSQNIARETKGPIFKDRSVLESQELEERELSMEAQLAKTLSEELQLNYDYYRPLSESDLSLSFNVTL